MLLFVSGTPIMNRLIACNSCQTTLSLAHNLKPNTRVRCPKCGNAVDVDAVQVKKILPAEPIPATQPRPVPSKNLSATGSLLWLAIPTCSIVVASLSLVLPIFLGQYIVSLGLSFVAALVSVIGIALLALGRTKGHAVHLAGAAISAAAMLVAINAIILKSSIETNTALRDKNEQAVVQAKADLDEAAKKLSAAELTLKRAEVEPLKAEKFYDLAKAVQEKSEANEKTAADLLAKAKETEIKNNKNRVKNADDRIAVEETQNNLKKMQAAFEDAKKDVDDKRKELAEQNAELAKTKKKVDADMKAAEDKENNAKDLLRKIEGVLKGAAFKLKDKNPQVRFKTAVALGELPNAAIVKDVVAERLVEAMFDPFSDVQKAAGVSLEKIDPDIHPHVLTIAIGQNKYGAIVELTKLGTRAKNSLPAIVHYHNAITKAGRSDFGYVLEEITKIAPEDQRTINLVFAELLRTNGFDGKTRVAAIGSLKYLKIDNKARTSVLLKALNDGQIHIAVIEAIGSIGPDAKEAIPVLTKLKFSPDDFTRRTATKALLAINPMK